MSLNLHDIRMNSSVCVRKNLVFQIVLKSDLWEGLVCLSKVFEKLVNNRLVDHLDKHDLFTDFWCDFWSWSTTDFLTIKEFLGFLIGLGLLELYHLIQAGLSTAFGMLVLFTNLSFMRFKMGYLALSNLFSVIKGSILGPKLLRYMNDLPTDGICKATENFFSKFCIQLKLAKKKSYSFYCFS